MIGLDALHAAPEHGLRDVTWRALCKCLTRVLLLRAVVGEQALKIQAAAQVGAHQLYALEAHLRGEVVIDGRQDLGLDLMDRDIELRLLANVVRVRRGVRNLELHVRFVSGLQAHDPLVELDRHQTATHLVEVLVDLVSLIGLAVDVADEGDDREVVSLQRTVLHRLERCELVARDLDLLVDLRLGGLPRRHGDGDPVDMCEAQFGAKLDLRGVCEVLARNDHVDTIKLGRVDRAQLLGVDGLRVGLFDECLGRLGENVVTSEVVVDDRARCLAAAKARDAHLRAELVVRLLDRGVDLLGRHGDGQFDGVVFESLDVRGQHGRILSLYDVHRTCTGTFTAWCGREDSNLHEFPHRNLSPARLPVPPRPQFERLPIIANGVTSSRG